MIRLKVLILLGLVFGSDAQTVAVESFLAGADEDMRLESRRKTVAYLENSLWSVPFLDGVELRYDLDGLDVNRHKFAARLEMRGLGETFTGKRLSHNRLHYHRWAEKEMLNEKLYDRYKLVLELIHKRIEMRHRLELREVYEDKITVYRSRMNEEDFDFSNLVEAQDELTKMRLQIIRNEKKLEDIIREISEYRPFTAENNFDTTNFVRLRDIDSLLEHINPDTLNVHIQLAWWELKESQSRYELERSEGRDLVQFLEFGYDHRIYEGIRKDRTPAYENMHVGTGISIPIPDKNDIHRRKAALLKDEGKYLEKRKEIHQRITELKSDMQIMLKQITILEKRTDDLNRNEEMKEYLRVAGTDPLLILKTRESILESAMEIEEFRFDIYIAYVKLLNISGMLTNGELKNYLDKNFQVIKGNE